MWPWWRTAGSARFNGDGYSGRVARAGGVAVPSAPLHDILLAHNISAVDFLAIDIEGNEVEALASMDWRAVTVDLVLAEEVWSNDALPMLLHDGGFWRVADVGYADGLYARAPSIIKQRHMDTRHRQSNWNYVAGLRRGDALYPRHLPVSEEPGGDAVLFVKSGKPAGAGGSC